MCHKYFVRPLYTAFGRCVESHPRNFPLGLYSRPNLLQGFMRVGRKLSHYLAKANLCFAKVVSLVVRKRFIVHFVLASEFNECPQQS